MDQNAQPNTQNTQTLEEMQKQIAASLGISSLPDDRQKELIEKSTEILLQKIFLEILDHLSEEDKKSYLELIEKESQPDVVEKFLNEKIADYKEITQKVVSDFVSGMKAAGA